MRFPADIDDPKTPKTVVDVRKLIQEYMYNGNSLAASLIMRVRRESDAAGFSSEDFYTWLSYYALCHIERMDETIKDYVSLQLQPLIINKNDIVGPK